MREDHVSANRNIMTYWQKNLSDADRQTLITCARAALRMGISDTALTSPPEGNDCLREPAAVFVTLYRGKQLRGCVGTLEAAQPLYEAVERMARAAAFLDHRFPPVQPEEVDSLTIEISVLSPLRRVVQPEEIVPGHHGVVLVSSNRRAVFLPKVALEQGWDRTTLLDELCYKAGLPPKAWQNEDASLYVFTVVSTRAEPMIPA